MGYKYEELVISTVYDLNSEMYPDKEIEIIKSELKEVYAKAKAWDNYLADLENSVCEVTDNEDEVKWHIDYAINDYMEDK